MRANLIRSYDRLDYQMRCAPELASSQTEKERERPTQIDASDGLLETLEGPEDIPSLTDVCLSRGEDTDDHKVNCYVPSLTVHTHTTVPQEHRDGIGIQNHANMSSTKRLPQGCLLFPLDGKITFRLATPGPLVLTPYKKGFEDAIRVSVH